jgi:putative transposase
MMLPLTHAGMCCRAMGKRIKGRKRQIVADTVGLLVSLAVHGADVQDRPSQRCKHRLPGKGRRAGSAEIHRQGNSFVAPRLCPLSAMDGGYGGLKLRDALDKIGKWTVQIGKRSDTARGFEVIPRPLSRFEGKPLPGSGWVAERTFAWLGRCRRMAKDWEKNIANAEAWLLIAHIRHVTCHLART